MSVRGILTALISAVLVSLISAFNFKIAMYIIAIYYGMKALLYVINKDFYKKFDKISNIDRYNAYIKKDDEFKKYIKSDPLADILISGIFIYIGFSLSNKINSSTYYVMIFLFILFNYFIEVYAMTKSKSWEDYKKKSGMASLAIIAIILLLFR